MGGTLIDEAIDRIKEVTSLLLLQMGAIRINLDQPFRLVSGNYSPIYVNCRQAISRPTFMEIYVAYASMICERKGIQVDVVAGGETAGIAFAAYFAQSKSLPMVYVRKASKDHGLTGLVEGSLAAEAKVLLVEDLITDAQSKLQFVDSIHACGGVVKDVFVLFDRLQGGSLALEKHGIELHALTNMTSVLAVASQTEHLSERELQSVNEYLAAPKEWHSKHGLPYHA
ncbi:MAG TPA: orotate phosphoribosyltransferase [Pyrinomonadaceae bacterium]|nr:orotate phosphoribosyltransferase [Pyrinomonadaceae bacterium]